MTATLVRCPACHESIDENASECPRCGVIPARWHGDRDARSDRRGPRPRRRPATARAPRRGRSRPMRAAGAGLLAGTALVAGAWYFGFRPELERLGEQVTRIARPVAPGGRFFDLAVALPAEPAGLAWNGTEWVGPVAGEPYGLFRVASEKATETIPVGDRPLALRALAWRGDAWVGVVDGAHFAVESPNVYTVLDPATFRIERMVEAPAGLAALAWDGTGWWAATRAGASRSTAASLLRLDPDFNAVARFDAPTPACSGLAWDGVWLWWADGHTNDLAVIDVSGLTPRIARRATTRIDGLVGLAWNGKDLWVAERSPHRLRRMSPTERTAWTRGAEAAARRDSFEELRRSLRSSHWAERVSAEMELRRHGAAVDFDREESPFVERRSDEAALIDWQAEVSGSRLVASWGLWFGRELAVAPARARYAVEVKGGPLARPIRREYEAVSGENRRRDVELAAGLAPGRYQIELSVWAQWVDGTGANRRLDSRVGALEVDR